MKSRSNIAVITGGSSGIGLAVAHKLAEQGISHLYLLARTKRSLQRAAKRLQKAYPKLNVATLSVDVGSFDQVKSAFASIAQQHKRIDYMFLAAGDNRSEKLSESQDAEAFSQDLHINLVGTYSCLLCALPLLGQGSSVVTVASIRGQLPSPSGLGYAAAKGGLLALTRSTALQLAPKGIRANCVAPGAVYPTGMSEHWEADKQARIAQSAPLNFIPKPEDIAEAVWFLLSPASRAITGQTLSCNAGEYMT